MSEIYKISIGVDPGSTSGAIVINKDGHLSIFGMDRKTEHEIQKVFFDAILSKGMGTHLFAIIERVNSMPGQGVSSSFKFGQNYGFLRGCLAAHGIPFRDLMPKEWQKFYSMAKKKDEPGDAWKKRLLNVAQNLYPKAEIPLYAADAVLLSHLAMNQLK